MSEKLPSVTPKELIRALTKAGFALHHVRGSHYVMMHPQTRKRVPVPYHATDLKKGMLHGILKQVGLTREAFLELL